MARNRLDLSRFPPLNSPVASTPPRRDQPMIRSRLAALCALVIGLTLTPLVRADDPKLLTKIAFGSCVDQDKPVPIFDTIAAAKPDLLLLMGDNMYADLDKKLKVTPDVIRDKY